VEGRDDSKEYRLASRESGRVRELEERGYRVIKDDEGLALPGIQVNQADKTLGNRDVVLMVKDKNDYLEDQQEKVRDNDSRLRRENEKHIENMLSKGMMTDAEAKAILEGREGIVQRRER